MATVPLGLFYKPFYWILIRNLNWEVVCEFHFWSLPMPLMMLHTNFKCSRWKHYVSGCVVKRLFSTNISVGFGNINSGCTVKDSIIFDSFSWSMGLHFLFFPPKNIFLALRPVFSVILVRAAPLPLPSLELGGCYLFVVVARGFCVNALIDGLSWAPQAPWLTAGCRFRAQLVQHLPLTLSVFVFQKVLNWMSFYCSKQNRLPSITRVLMMLGNTCTTPSSVSLFFFSNSCGDCVSPSMWIEKKSVS